MKKLSNTNQFWLQVILQRNRSLRSIESCSNHVYRDSRSKSGCGERVCQMLRYASWFHQNQLVHSELVFEGLFRHFHRYAIQGMTSNLFYWLVSSSLRSNLTIPASFCMLSLYILTIWSCSETLFRLFHRVMPKEPNEFCSRPSQPKWKI